MLWVHGGSCVVLLWSGQQLDDDADYSLSVLLVVFCIILFPTSYAAALPCPALPCMGASPAQPVAAEHCCLSGVSCPASWPSHLVTSFPRIERLRPELLPAWAKQ